MNWTLSDHLHDIYARAWIRLVLAALAVKRYLFTFPDENGWQ